MLEIRVFVEGTATFVITDDLKLLPNDSSTSIAQRILVANTCFLEDRTMKVGLKVLMESNSVCCDFEEDEEYVMLDLDGVFGQVDIPPNAPYVLSGLDTLNPLLIIGDKLKLVGEYEETIGTCLVFSEDDTTPVVHEETGPSEANLFMGKCIIDPNQTAAKQLKSVARLHKILKFRLFSEVDSEDAAAKPTNSNF